MVADLTLPSSLLPRPGYQVLEVRLDGIDDSEPRDDARLFVIEVSPQPTAVVLAAPPDWESRFFARDPRGCGAGAGAALRAHRARALARRRHAGAGRDRRDRAGRGGSATRRADRRSGGARALPAPLGRSGLAAVDGAAGDWYVDPPPASPLAGSLAGVAWDSLPPAAGLTELPADSAATVLLTARLGRRGLATAARPGPGFRREPERRRRRDGIVALGLSRWGTGRSVPHIRGRRSPTGCWRSEGAGSRERFGAGTSPKLRMDWRSTGAGEKALPRAPRSWCWSRRRDRAPTPCGSTPRAMLPFASRRGPIAGARLTGPSGASWRSSSTPTNGVPLR